MIAVRLSSTLNRLEFFPYNYLGRKMSRFSIDIFRQKVFMSFVVIGLICNTYTGGSLIPWWPGLDLKPHHMPAVDYSPV